MTFLISYRVYIMTWSFEGTLHVDKIHVRFKNGNITQALPDTVPLFMIPLRGFVPERNSRSSTTTGVKSRRGDSRRHDILRWHHVNKCRAMRGNWGELVPARKSPRSHVNIPYLPASSLTCASSGEVLETVSQ